MDSKTYWKLREEAQKQRNIKDEVLYAREIGKIYSYMLDQIQKEINGFYTKYVKAEGITVAEAKKRVSKLDMEVYERKAAKYVKDKNFTKEANEEMRLYNASMKINRLEMLKASIGLELVAGFDELQKYFDGKLTDRTLQEFERQAGILGNGVKDSAEAAHAIVNASFKNAKFSDRIWMYQDMLKNELAQLLRTGLIQGKHPRELARHLEKRFGVSRYNAQRLMITELARVQTEAQKQSYERNGFEEYEFIAESTACPVCLALDGKHFKVEKMMPGTNAAPMHPNCRCSTAAYTDEAEYRAWLDGYKEHGLSFEEWKKRNVPKSVAKHSEPDIINSSSTKEEAELNKIRALGKIKREIIEQEFGKIQTDEIIVTNEREEHIKARHPDDYELFQKYGAAAVRNPDFIIRDGKNAGTVFMVKKLPDTNLNVVVRVALETDVEGLKNSVMTFYRIRERNLRKMIEKNSILIEKDSVLYKKE